MFLLVLLRAGCSCLRFPPLSFCKINNLKELVFFCLSSQGLDVSPSVHSRSRGLPSITLKSYFFSMAWRPPLYSPKGWAFSHYMIRRDGIPQSVFPRVGVFFTLSSRELVVPFLVFLRAGVFYCFSKSWVYLLLFSKANGFPLCLEVWEISTEFSQSLVFPPPSFPDLGIPPPCFWELGFPTFFSWEIGSPFYLPMAWRFFSFVLLSFKVSPFVYLKAEVPHPNFSWELYFFFEVWEFILLSSQGLRYFPFVFRRTGIILL